MFVRQLHALAAAAARKLIGIFEVKTRVELIAGQNQFGPDQRKQQHFGEIDFNAVRYGDIKVRRDLTGRHRLEFILPARAALFIDMHAHAVEALKLGGQEGGGIVGYGEQWLHISIFSTKTGKSLSICLT